MTELNKLATGIRDAATIALLWVVWHHAHWSVALTITLLGLAVELRNIREQMAAERTRERAPKEQA